MSHYTFKMPDIGEGVVEAEIVAWHVKVGDAVNEDDPVADAMTDKATIELTAPVDGTVESLGCEEGDKIAVGSALVVFETDGEVEDSSAAEMSDIPDERSEDPGSGKSKDPLKAKQDDSGPGSSPGTPASEKVLASPKVRKIAADRGIDLAAVRGSGPNGRITERDVEIPSPAGAVSGDYRTPAAIALPELIDGEERVKVIGLRRLIAERMEDAKRSIPHFTYVEEIDVTELEAFRRRANDTRTEDRPKLTVLPFIIRALCMAFEQWPQFNSRYYDHAGQLSTFATVHLGIAAQTDQGLVVPVLRHAETRTLWDMARELDRLATGAREQTLSREELSGATTTLTSLGPLGGIVTTPVINRPEVAIFGPNKIRPKLEMRDGNVVERLVMNFSVSCDHRIIDGYDAAAMVQYLKGLLEDPAGLFL